MVATPRVSWCLGDGRVPGGMMPLPTVRLAWRSPCASIITPAASLPCHEEAPVRHSQISISVPTTLRDDGSYIRYRRCDRRLDGGWLVYVRRRPGRRQ